MKRKDISKTSFFISLALLFVGGIVVLAFSGPSQAPSGGDPQFWKANGSDLYYITGNVGVGTTTPSYPLSVVGGDVYASSSLRGASGICIAGSCITSWDDIPAGAVMSFDLSSCPTGWSELTTARGRYLVGLPSGGTLAGTAGTALSNQENRAVGQHSHTIDDPGHSHGNATDIVSPGGLGAGGGFLSLYEAGGEAYSEITIENSGDVAGTNAPYIQLLMCEKD